SFKEELKDCDQLWKLSQNKNALFWSMGICYSLLKTTGVEMWDQLFARESSFIEKYGLDRNEIVVFTREGTLGATTFGKINNFLLSLLRNYHHFFAIFERYYVFGA
ncbi:hypothetical protein RFI_40244, partial [Reticulomyxa filosa]